MTTTSSPETSAATSPGAPGVAQTAPYVERATPIWKLAQLLVRVWCSIWFDLKVYGIKNVPRTGGVLIVSNHQSYLDPLVLGARVSAGATSRPSTRAPLASTLRASSSWAPSSVRTFPSRMSKVPWR